VVSDYHQLHLVTQLLATRDLRRADPVIRAIIYYNSARIQA